MCKSTPPLNIYTTCYSPDILNLSFICYVFMLPVKSLREPPPQFLVRDCNEKVVSVLKEEIMLNPFSDVQPILCMVSLKDGEIFDKTKKEGFLYHTLGENHSRQALQEILKENPHLQSQVYTNRLCAAHGGKTGKTPWV